MKTKATRKKSESADVKLSDALIAGLMRDTRNIMVSKMNALAEYELTLRTAPDNTDLQMKKLHLFDRAAARHAKAEEIYRRAYNRQPEDFERVISKIKE